LAFAFPGPCPKPLDTCTLGEGFCSRSGEEGAKGRRSEAGGQRATGAGAWSIIFLIRMRLFHFEIKNVQPVRLAVSFWIKLFTHATSQRIWKISGGEHTSFCTSPRTFALPRRSGAASFRAPSPVTRCDNATPFASIRLGLGLVNHNQTCYD
jgi:hypothetical protein